MAWWSVPFCDPSIAIQMLYMFGAIRPTFRMMTWRLLTWTQISKGSQVYFLELKVPSSNTSSRADPSLGYNAWKRSKMESTLGAAEHCTWPWRCGSSHLGTFECSQCHDNSSKVFRFYMFVNKGSNKKRKTWGQGWLSVPLNAKLPCKVHQPRVAANRPIWP